MEFGMWGYEELTAKAKLYFDRAANHSEADDEFALWLLLGLEFLLRAPLAKVHPSLLAAPEGNSLLHAAGILKADAQPRSVMTKTVVERLKFVIEGFGDDRQRDATFLANLRNQELHSADAALANVPEDQWLPRFIAVVKAVTEHLEMPVSEVLDPAIAAHAEKLSIEADRAVQRTVQGLIQQCKFMYDHLTEAEREARIAAATRTPQGNRVIHINAVPCPACGNEAPLQLTPGRTTKSKYDEDSGEIAYSVIHLATGLTCKVCGLVLDDTAKVIAAGIPRMRVIEYSEDRYEGWEDVVDTTSLQERMAYDWDAYGND
ncbi:hypothetical protein AB0J80_13430 [Actinoplanes sp. NPDC049548]|uniref:hypothetical protein n=1 Tax=Actinoplanes sp. NPDC049548 TaxID=3155152 RepID=UPI0034277854